jgi:protein SCO1/2
MKAALLFMLLGLIGLGWPAHAAAPFDPFAAAGVDEHPGAQVPLDATFRDQAGAAVTLRQLAGGRPILLVPVQHRCPNLCGFTLDGLAQALRAQGARPGRDLTLVAFGIDPAEQTADAAISEARLTHALGHPDGVYALTGPAPQVGAVTQALGYRYAWDPRLSQYAHVAAAAVLTPNGKLAGWVYGVRPPPAVLARALDAARRGGVAALGDRLILLCYHYDARTGRYDPLAMTLLRGGAATAVVALGGFVGVSLLRDRRRRSSAP